MDGCPFPSRDGRLLYIASTRPGGFGGIDIWVAARPSEQAPWGTPVNLGPQINTEHNEFCPSPQRGGRFMFVSNRPGGCGGGDIYATRLGARHGWQTPFNLGCGVNSPAEEAGPVRVRHALYFSSTRPGGLGVTDVWASRRPHPWASWSPPRNLGPAVNSAAAETRPSLSTDGTILYFGSTRGASQDVFSSTRSR